MSNELLLPIANISRLSKTAKRAAYTRPESDRPGHTRRVPAADKVLTTVDQHPWGDVVWALYPSRYLAARRNWDADYVWRYFEPVRLTVRHPQRTVRQEHEVHPLRTFWPASRIEWRATSVGVGLGATLTGATLTIDQLAGAMPTPVEFSLYGIAAMTPLLALMTHRYRGARSTWLVDDGQKRKRIATVRGLHRHAPAMPPDVLAAISAAADAWQYVLGLEHKPGRLLDHLQTLHERMYELLGSAPSWGTPSVGVLTYSEQLADLAIELILMADEHNDRTNKASASPVDPMDIPPADEPVVTLDVDGIRDDVDRIRHQRQAAAELAEQTLEDFDRKVLPP